MANDKEITAENLFSGEKYFIIDMREESAFSLGHIQGAVLMSAEKIASADLPKEKKIVVYCERGILSEEVVENLVNRGYDAYGLKEGYVAYLREKIKREKWTEAKEKAEDSIRRKFHKELWTPFAKAIVSYDLVKEKDKIAVCISGGKDSFLMAKLFEELKRHNKFPFELVFLVMDPGYSAANREIIELNAKKLGVPITIFESDIFDNVFNIEKSPCYICARMRRGHLYSKAKELGCNKIALGHHYDDVIETTLMGMLYGGQVQTMMPKLKSTNFEGMELIRPLYLIREADIKKWRDYNGLSFLQCACKFTDTCSTCGGEHTSKRVEIKNLIAEIKKTNPFVEQNIFKSMENVCLDTVIAYKKKGVTHRFTDEY